MVSLLLAKEGCLRISIFRCSDVGCMKVLDMNMNLAAMNYLLLLDYVLEIILSLVFDRTSYSHDESFYDHYQRESTRGR
jgi:hypothetical protein